MSVINKIKKIRFLLKTFGGSMGYQYIVDEAFSLERIRKLKVEGLDIFLRTSTVDSIVAYHCLKQREFQDIKLVNPQFIIDAGANIGASTIFFAEKYPNAKIVAIEPESHNFELLKQNTARYSNVTLVKGGLWSSAGKRVLVDRNTGPWGFTLKRDGGSQAGDYMEEIDCYTVLDLMEMVGKNEIDFLKMDIEGGEKEVFEASTNWISSVRVISVELHDRIVMGCSRAFYLATKDFTQFEMAGEKVVARQ